MISRVFGVVNDEGGGGRAAGRGMEGLIFDIFF